MVVGHSKWTATKHAGKLLGFLIAMRMWRYNAGRIARWSTSRASLDCYWTPPSGKCLHRIALVASMVNGFIEITQNNNKTQLLAINYGTF